jgi:ribosomal protein L30/L7E
MLTFGISLDVTVRKKSDNHLSCKLCDRFSRHWAYWRYTQNVFATLGLLKIHSKSFRDIGHIEGTLKTFSRHWAYWRYTQKIFATLGLSKIHSKRFRDIGPIEDTLKKFSRHWAYWRYTQKVFATLGLSKILSKRCFPGRCWKFALAE